MKKGTIALVSLGCAKNAVDLQVRAGRITDTLTEQLIEPFKPDLVICGERGLSNMQYAFVGSVSKYLIRTVRCDVHVVKA